MTIEQCVAKIDIYIIDLSVAPTASTSDQLTWVAKYRQVKKTRLGIYLNRNSTDYSRLLQHPQRSLHRVGGTTTDRRCRRILARLQLGNNSPTRVRLDYESGHEVVEEIE